MIRTSSLFMVWVLVAVWGLQSASAAGLPKTKTLGKYGYWSAYETTDGKDPVCYMVLKAKPPVPKGAKGRRGDVTLMITHRPAESALDVVSYAAGIKYKPGTDVKVAAGKKSFDLFTQGDTAWSRDSATDRALTNALRNEPSVVFSGTASSGKTIADAVSLKGASEAYYAIGKACGLSVEKPKPPKAPTKEQKKTTSTKKKK